VLEGSGHWNHLRGVCHSQHGLPEAPGPTGRDPRRQPRREPRIVARPKPHYHRPALLDKALINCLKSEARAIARGVSAPDRRQLPWPAGDNYFGRSPAVLLRCGRVLRYRRHETTYQEWCDWCWKNFRSRNLKRQQFPEIVKGITVTKSLREAIVTLKADGFITAIISGGMDVFLEELIPDADQLFDHIFVNKIKFDQEGIISGIDATPYDFEGKVNALELICAKHGYHISDAVFVGEGFNDEFVAAKAGLTIAYPPTDQGFRTASAIEIEEDDLLKVVDRVLIV
jgi:phosphoserine phosphatase